jgi:anti-anti-sigma factor
MRSQQTSRFPVSHLQMQDTVSDRCHRLILSGELDIASAPELRAVILSLCDGAINTLTLDFRKLTFLDSSGVHVVLLAKDVCHERGCDLLIVPGPAHVQRPFELCGPFPGLRFASSPSTPASNTSTATFNPPLLAGSDR